FAYRDITAHSPQRWQAVLSAERQVYYALPHRKYRSPDAVARVRVSLDAMDDRPITTCRTKFVAQGACFQIDRGDQVPGRSIREIVRDVGAHRQAHAGIKNLRLAIDHRSHDAGCGQSVYR